MWLHVTAFVFFPVMCGRQFIFHVIPKLNFVILLGLGVIINENI